MKQYSEVICLKTLTPAVILYIHILFLYEYLYVLLFHVQSIH